MPELAEVPGLRQEPRRFGAGRRALFKGVERAAVLCGGRHFYRKRFLTPNRLRVRHEQLRVTALPREFAGLRIVQLSDLHGGSFLRAGDLAGVVEVARSLEPDLAVLTGDVITRHWAESLPLLEDLAQLAPPLGFFGVFGNHDYKGREEGRIQAAYAQRGIRFLRNEAVFLERGGARLALTGLEDLEEGREVDLARARRELAPTDFEICLCHNPGGAAALLRERLMAVLCGHTHGSQLALWPFDRMGPAHPGPRVQLGDTTVITSNGLGTIGLPLRWRAPAELVLVELLAV